MKYKITKPTLVLTLLASSLLSYGQNTPLSVSLEQATQMALEHHQGLQNARLDVEMAEFQVDEVTSMGLPQISGSGSFAHSYEIATQVIPGDFVGQPGTTVPVQFGVPFSMTGTVSMNQLIFDGTFFLGLKAASEFVKVSELLESKSEIDVKEGVLKAYYMALISSQNIEQIEKSLKNIEQMKTETQKLYETGYAEKLDVDRLELSASNLEITLNNLKQQALLAKKLLLNSMGQNVQQDVELTSSLPEYNELAPSAPLNSDFSVTNRIEYKVVEQQLVLNELQLKRYKVGYIPSIYGMVNYGANSFASSGQFDQLGKDWYPNGMYAISLNVPIFDGLYKRSKANQARVDIAKTKNTLNQLENGIQLEVIQAQTQYMSAFRALELQSKSKDLAEEIYRTTSIKFKEGVGSSFEMIQAESELTQANTNYLNALYELSVAKINLDKALGQL